MFRPTWLLALILAFAALGPGSATMGAQTPWVDAGDGSSVVLEVYKPFLDGDEGFATSLWYATIYGRVSDRIRLVGEVPVGYADFDGGASEVSLGNAFVGIEYATTPGLDVLAGIRLPTSTSNLGALIGARTDRIDRPGNFGQDIVTLTAGFDYESRGEDGLGFNVYMKPNMVIQTGEFGGDAEFAFAFGGGVGYYDPRGSVSGGITGFWLAEFFGDDPLAGLLQLGVSGQLNLGTLRPGAVIRVPLNDNYRLVTDFVLGLSLTVVPGG